MAGKGQPLVGWLFSASIGPPVYGVYGVPSVYVVYTVYRLLVVRLRRGTTDTRAVRREANGYMQVKRAFTGQ